MGFKSVLRFVFRIICRLTLGTFLLTTPVTIFPLICGIGSGISFHFWSHRQVEQHTHALIYEVDTKNSFDYLNVPGALTIHEFLDQKGPFHIPSLKTFDWAVKLGVILPNEHQFDDAAGLDKIASLAGLVRKVDSNYSGYPARCWVYVTSLPEWRADPWDDAFSALLQHLYVNPLPQDTAIFYLDCADASFLCGVWGVKSPSLVHFEVGNESLANSQVSGDPQEDNSELRWLDGMLAPEYTYNHLKQDLLPMTARVIELPLEGDVASKMLPRSVFPTPSLQLRTLILDLAPEDIPAMWDEYSPVVQLIRRFQDYVDDLCSRQGTWWYFLTEADNWYSNHVLEPILEPILGTEFTGRAGGMAEFEGVFFTVTILLAELARMPFHLCWSVYAWYFGLGWDGLPMSTYALPAQQENSGGSGANMWDDMMADFWDSVARNLSAQESDKAGRVAVTGQASI